MQYGKRNLDLKKGESRTGKCCERLGEKNALKKAGRRSPKKDVRKSNRHRGRSGKGYRKE